MAPSSTVHAWYALRRTLPTWSFAENLRELVDALPRYRVDEVIIKVDTEEFTHGQPPLEWVRAYQPLLFQIRDAMERLHIRYSLNPWITVGHCDRGRDAERQLPGLRTVIGHDGARSTCCACPLSDVWRSHVEAVWTLYAQTQAAVIWVEDDIRTFNHGPVRYGCFCAEHLRRFSERVGEPVQREQLVTALLQPGEPHPWRAAYLDLQAEIMTETAGFLARIVHRTAPDTHLGLMSSGPRTHCLEGRRWRDFATALADGGTVYSRPPMGNYSENALRGFYYSHDSIKITRHCLPTETIEQTEVENVPFTRYAKSVTFTFLEMAISFAYGSHGVTMNLFDHAGTPMEDEAHYGAMLAARKPFLEALARCAQKPGRFRGIRLLHHERESYHKRLAPDAAYAALGGDGATMMQLLESHGLPTTYAAEAVVATSGQQLRACTDKEIQSLLEGGLLLDGTAAQVLAERGYAADIGLRNIASPRGIDALGAYSAEEFFNADFGGREKTFLTLTVPSLGGRPDLAVAELLPAARPICRIVDPDARPQHISMYAYENQRGGRVVVHLLDLDSAFGVAFCHPHRAVQLRAVTDWLHRGRSPIAVTGGVYPLALRRDCGPQTLLGLFNLTLDPWPKVEFTLHDTRRIAGLQRLAPDGIWNADGAISARTQGDLHAIRLEREIPFHEPLFLTVAWDQ